MVLCYKQHKPKTNLKIRMRRKKVKVFAFSFFCQWIFGTEIPKFINNIESLAIIMTRTVLYQCSLWYRNLWQHKSLLGGGSIVFLVLDLCVVTFQFVDPPSSHCFLSHFYKSLNMTVKHIRHSADERSTKIIFFLFRPFLLWDH